MLAMFYQTDKMWPFITIYPSHQPFQCYKILIKSKHMWVISPVFQGCQDFYKISKYHE